MKRRILIILIVLLSSLCYAQVTNYPLHNFLMLQPVQENEKLCLTNCSIEIKVDEGEFAFISCTTTYTIDNKSKKNSGIDFILYETPDPLQKAGLPGFDGYKPSIYCYYKINNSQQIALKMSQKYNYTICSYEIEKNGRPYYDFNTTLLQKGINVISIKSTYVMYSDWVEGYYFALDFTEPMHWNMENFEGCKIVIDRPNEYLRIRNLSNIEIMGDGKHNDDTYYMHSGILQAKLDTLPKELVEIEMVGVRSGVCIDPETFSASQLKNADDYFKLCYWLIRKNGAPWYIPGLFDDTVSILEKLNKSQLRYLRNSFYAIYGYVFKSAELNDFFDTSLARVKDPSVTEEKILNRDRAWPECFRILIETIKGIENGEEPRKCYDKTIHKYYSDSDMEYTG